jgi:hypothetical protein
MENVLNTVLGVVLGTIATIIVTRWQGLSQRRTMEREDVKELVDRLAKRRSLDEMREERKEVKYVTASILNIRDWSEHVYVRARNPRGRETLTLMMQACNDYLDAQQDHFRVDWAEGGSEEQMHFMNALGVVQPKIRNGAKKLRDVYQIPEATTGPS